MIVSGDYNAKCWKQNRAHCTSLSPNFSARQRIKWNIINGEENERKNKTNIAVRKSKSKFVENAKTNATSINC